MFLRYMKSAFTPRCTILEVSFQYVRCTKYYVRPRGMCNESNARSILEVLHKFLRHMKSTFTLRCCKVKVRLEYVRCKKCCIRPRGMYNESNTRNVLVLQK